MFRLNSGILYKNNKPIIAIGQSYYASFHEAKYPLPPSGDRIGLMKEDIQLMKDAGFQFIRIAALGELSIGNHDKYRPET